MAAHTEDTEATVAAQAAQVVQLVQAVQVRLADRQQVLAGPVGQPGPQPVLVDLADPVGLAVPPLVVPAAARAIVEMAMAIAGMAMAMAAAMLAMVSLVLQGLARDPRLSRTSSRLRAIVHLGSIGSTL